VKLGAGEVLRRQDILTLSAYALALTAAGRFEEARIQMDRALAPGIRDAGLFLRAGLIAAKVHDNASAAKYLEQARQIDAKAIHLPL
jgi:Tfp pilus assembly protein PilF